MKQARTSKSIEKVQNGLIFFYEEWCPYCQEFMPDWKLVCKKNTIQELLSVNCTKYPALKEEYHATPVPCIFKVKNGKRTRVGKSPSTRKTLLKKVK